MWSQFIWICHYVIINKWKWDWRADRARDRHWLLPFNCCPNERVLMRINNIDAPSIKDAVALLSLCHLVFWRVLGKSYVLPVLNYSNKEMLKMFVNNFFNLIVSCHGLISHISNDNTFLQSLVARSCTYTACSIPNI